MLYRLEQSTQAKEVGQEQCRKWGQETYLTKASDRTDKQQQQQGKGESRRARDTLGLRAVLSKDKRNNGEESPTI